MSTVCTRAFALTACLLLPVLAACGGGGGGGGGGAGGGGGGGGGVLPPKLALTQPALAQAVYRGEPLRVTVLAQSDAAATVRIYLDPDGDLATPAGQVLLYSGLDANGAPLEQDFPTGALALGRTRLVATIDDGANPVLLRQGPVVLVYPAVAGVAPPRSSTYGVLADAVVFAVGEAEQNNTPLNQDGGVPAADDGVLAVLDTVTGVLSQSATSCDVRGTDAQGTARVLVAEGTALQFLHREADENQNLNAAAGDFDLLDGCAGYVRKNDPVPHVHLYAGATPFPLPAAGPGHVVLYREAEQGAGGTDLDADGDTLDQVFGVLDDATNTVVFLQPAARPATAFLVDQGVGAYLASETAQGADLNGDGDQLDTLLAIAATSTVAPGPGLLALAGARTAPFQAPRTVDGNAAFALNAQRFAGYLIDEAKTSAVPLNGDADVTDFVPALYDAATQTETILGAGWNVGPGARFMAFDGTRLFFTVMEEGTDRNGDGDGLDTEVLCWADHAIVPPAVGVLPVTLPGRTGLVLDGGSARRVAPGWIALVVNETANGLDLNGDGFVSQSVYALLDAQAATPTLHWMGLVPTAGGSIPVTGVGGDTGVVVRAVETLNGDLNGDGDNTDTLLFYLRFGNPPTRVALPDTGGDHAAVAGDVIAVTANEAYTNQDFDGNGAFTDFVFRVFDGTGAVLEPGVASAQVSRPAVHLGGVFAYLRAEAGTDRNGDGDAADLLLGVWLK